MGTPGHEFQDLNAGCQRSCMPRKRGTIATQNGVAPSAGGFKAYCTILSLLPADTGLAFIIVHHQPADGKSLLVELLPRFTEMPVVLLADGEIVKADHV